MDVGLSVGLLVGIIVGFAMGRRRVLLADYFEMPKLVPVTIAHSTQFAHSITYLIVACLGFALNSIVQTPVPHICCELPHLGDNLKIGRSIVSEQPRSVDYYNHAFAFDQVDLGMIFVDCYVSFDSISFETYFEIGRSKDLEHPRFFDDCNCAFSFDRFDRELSFADCHVLFDEYSFETNLKFGILPVGCWEVASPVNSNDINTSSERESSEWRNALVIITDEHKNYILLPENGEVHTSAKKNF
jgi:hypothetical protein